MQKREFKEENGIFIIRIQMDLFDNSSYLDTNGIIGRRLSSRVLK